MVQKIILTHYHEIGLKGKNKPLFLRQLLDNIRRAVASLGSPKAEFIGDRIAIFSDIKTDTDKLAARLQKIPGIANIMLGYLSEETDHDLLQKVMAALHNENRIFASFRIEARRSDKTFPKTSDDINKELGRAIQDATGAKVNLTSPDLTVYVRILGKSRGIFFGFDKIAGCGGLPVGTGGTVVALLSGGIDSSVASWMMMKRGCRVVFVHFHSFPYLNKSTQEKCRDLAAALNPYQLDSVLYLIPFGDIQAAIVSGAPAAYRVLLYRRFMLRIAEKIAAKERAAAIVTGENLGQVASQTLENIAAVEDAATLPIFRPLIGMDKQEIIHRARSIGTYDISIRPDQDCCQLFVPRHPATRTSAAMLRRNEEGLDIESVVAKAVENSAIETFHCKSFVVGSIR